MERSLVVAKELVVMLEFYSYFLIVKKKVSWLQYKKPSYFKKKTQVNHTCSMATVP